MAPRIFFFNTLILIYFFEYETIETHARAFLTLIILAIAGVLSEGLSVKRISFLHYFDLSTFNDNSFISVSYEHM